MCGIAGLITLAGTAEELIPQVQAMVHAQRHRGPDDSGLEVLHASDPVAIFGHLRLAIIDLSPAGHQPMHDPTTGNWITFNGEIYNYRELRGELEKHGQVFKTSSDTEVILKAYAYWGEDCVRWLRGIFAFAIWQAGDRQKERSTPSLFIARDQLGVKPLYYWHHDETLLFASEVRAILVTGLVARRLNVAGLRSYLTYGSVQEPLTMIEKVQSLLPGETLTWREGHASISRYWRLPKPGQVCADTPSDVFEQVKERLSEAVRLQMVSDVPLGAFLSGGIDSTAIAALAQRAIDRPLKTLSVVFDETEYDERAYSRLAARHIGSNHTELCLTGESVVQKLPQALNAFDQPSMDGLNTYFVSQAAREAGLTVALSGLGGDELFGGYDGYRKQIMAERWGKRLAVFPESMRSSFSSLVSLVATRERLRKFACLIREPHDPYFLTRQVFTSLQIADLLEPETMYASENWRPETFTRLISETAGYDAINRSSAFDLQTYMLSTLLRDTDQMSMAHALEVRAPLIDHKLIEYLFTLHGACKLDSQQPKPLLTRSLNGAIPSECVHRPKRGFELPFAIWLKKSLQSQVRDTFLSQGTSSSVPFRREGLRKIWRQFDRGQIGWSRIWALYVLLNWLEQHKIAA